MLQNEIFAPLEDIVKNTESYIKLTNRARGRIRRMQKALRDVLFGQ